MDEWLESEGRPFGWFSEAEGRAYLEAVKRHPKGIIVELGAYLGRSLSFILEDAVKLGCQIYAVDLWNWVNNPDPTVRCPPCQVDLFKANLQRMGRESEVHIVVMDSVEAANLFDAEVVDVVMIDTTHRCEDTLREIDAWWPKLKHRGELLFHDYGITSPNWGGFTFVQDAVDKRFRYPDTLYGTLAVIVKTAGRKIS